LRSRFTDLKILVGRWGLTGSIEDNREALLSAGADLVETTLVETRVELLAWLPVLAQQIADTSYPKQQKQESSKSGIGFANAIN
jgi:hypothetical protein